VGGVPGRSAGEAFSAFDGHVTGRQIELVPGERIVQAWSFGCYRAGPKPENIHHARRLTIEATMRI